jgi:hypothetical protein
MPWSAGSRSVGGSDSVESSGGVAIASATTSSILQGKRMAAHQHIYVTGLGDETQRELGHIQFPRFQTQLYTYPMSE